MNIDTITKIYFFFLLLFLANSCSTPLVKIANSNIGSLYNSDPETFVNENDFDLDFIPNLDDKCPKVSETWNFFKDEDGCPDDASYPDSTILEIHEKDVNIFQKDLNTLTDEIKSMIMLEMWVLTEYPNTYYIINVKSPIDAEIKAIKIKEFLDEKIKDTNRTKIKFGTSNFDQCTLKLDVQKARELIIEKYN